MKIRSRGLGRRELQMNLQDFKLTREGNEVVLSGVTHAPVTWETNIRFRAEDIGGMIRVAMSPKVLRLALRWALRMKTPDMQASAVVWEKRTKPSTLSDHVRGRAGLEAGGAEDAGTQDEPETGATADIA